MWYATLLCTRKHVHHGLIWRQENVIDASCIGNVDQVLHDVVFLCLVLFRCIIFAFFIHFVTSHPLHSIARVSTEGTSIGFYPPTRVLPSDISKFGCNWCVEDRLNVNHTAILDCQVMETDRLQAFFDYAEMAAFHELLLEDKKSEDDPVKKTLKDNRSEDDPVKKTLLNAGNLTKLTDSNSHHAGFPALPFNTLRKVASCSTTSDEYNNNGGLLSSTATCVSRPGSPLVLDEEEPLSKRPKVESSTASPSQSLDSKGRRCQFNDCSKYAQGSTCYCIKHGGGRRCTVPMCSKGARDKLYCALHGGGKRCEVSACFKSAVGGSMFCTAHGGGKRCRFTNCGRSAQSSTFFCVKHGGGRKCLMESCSKVARGKTSYCAGHGRKMRGDDNMFDNPYCTDVSL